MIRDIAGRHNHSIKLARKLQRKTYRREHGLLVGEGMDLLRAAADAGVGVREVLVRRDLVEELPGAVLEPEAAVDIGVCDEDTLAYASSLGGSTDVIFIAPQPAWNLADLDLGVGPTVVLAGVGDPGNVGTLIRSCAAFGSQGVVCSPGTADPYSPKAMRAGMGAQFLVRVVTDVEVADLEARLDRLLRTGARRPEILVADPHAGEDIRGLCVDGGALVVLGAERGGPGDAWSLARRVTIPQRRFDSLNVAMAGTILLYELGRDRLANEETVR